MRITNGMMVSKYTKSLNNSLSDLNYYSNQVTSGRKFNKFSENPVMAARSCKLRNSESYIENYQNNIDDAKNFLLNAESAVMDIHSVIQQVSAGDCLQSINATSGADERQIIATKIRNVQGNILNTLNSQYARSYVFGGKNTADAPFTLSDTGELLFRGVNVNTGVIENGQDNTVLNVGGMTIDLGTEANADYFNQFTFNVVDDAAASAFNYDSASKTVTINKSQIADVADVQTLIQNCAFENMPANVSLADISVSYSDPADTNLTEGSATVKYKADLKELSSEQFFVDIGVGLKFNNDGSTVPQSALDMAVPGLSFLGYGVDENGQTNNVYELLTQIADNLESVDYSYDKVQPLVEKLINQDNTVVLGAITRIGVKTSSIDSMEDRFDDNDYYLKLKIQDTEYVDKAEAIMNMSMQEYAYRATLQMGANVLQSSLLDYLS